MTTNKITESAIEKFATNLRERRGCQYIYAPGSEIPKRISYEVVLLVERLKKAIGRIDSSIPVNIWGNAAKSVFEKLQTLDDNTRR